MINLTKIFALLIVTLYAFSSLAQGLINSDANIVIGSSTYVVISGGASGGYTSIGTGLIDSDGTIVLEGSWINNASNNAFINTDNQGVVEFRGAANQEIGGTVRTIFENLTINNGNRVYLNQNVDILYDLNLNSGKFDLKSYAANLQTTGSIVGETEANCITATDGAFVVGNNSGTIQATRTINNVSDFNPANLGCLITTNQNLGSVTVIRGHQIQTGSFEGTPTSGVARYYDVPGLAELDVTNISIDMYYWDSELNGLNEAALEGYQRVSYGADFWWTPLDGSINTSTNLFTTGGAPYDDWINTHPITFNNRFTLGSKESPLPVELLIFESVCHSDGVELNWITATETNNDYFILEKSSDGVNYSEIARVYGQGNSNSQSFYSYFDAADGKNNYYRLSQTDFDGLSESFPVIFADCFDGNAETDFVILNNPVDEEILVQITGEINNEYSIYLINQLGQQILLQRNHLSNTIELVRISAAGLNPGIYSIVFMSENDVITRQIVKTK
jgi:hypothetical protein